MAIALTAGSTTGTDKPTAGDVGAAGASGNATLIALMQQLIAGGTPQMQQDKATKNSEIATAQTNRAGYSKEAAFADSQGLMAQTLRMALEKLLPSINSASLGAGSSASSMRALLTQRAAENAAQNASADGAKQAVAYGQISNQFTDAIARLLSIQDPSTQLAIQASNSIKTGSSGSGGGGGGMSAGGGSLPYEPYPNKYITSNPPGGPTFFPTPSAPMLGGAGLTQFDLDQNFLDSAEGKTMIRTISENKTQDALRDLVSSVTF